MNFEKLIKFLEKAVSITEIISKYSFLILIYLIFILLYSSMFGGDIVLGIIFGTISHVCLFYKCF